MRISFDWFLLIILTYDTFALESQLNRHIQSQSFVPNSATNTNAFEFHVNTITVNNSTTNQGILKNITFISTKYFLIKSLD